MGDTNDPASPADSTQVPFPDQTADASLMHPQQRGRSRVAVKVLRVHASDLEEFFQDHSGLHENEGGSALRLRGNKRNLPRFRLVSHKGGKAFRMSETRHSISEAAQLSGIPAEVIHARIFSGDLSGEGNAAMPGNRQAGTVNGVTLERLIHEGKAAQQQPPTPAPVRVEWFQSVTLDAAAELGISSREVEGLLSCP